MNEDLSHEPTDHVAPISSSFWEALEGCKEDGHQHCVTLVYKNQTAHLAVTSKAEILQSQERAPKTYVTDSLRAKKTEAWLCSRSQDFTFSIFYRVADIQRLRCKPTILPPSPEE